MTEHDGHDQSDPACDMAHGLLPAPTQGRRLIAVFASPVALELTHFAAHVGFETVIVEPVPQRANDSIRYAADIASAKPDEHTDVVVTDHDRPELGELLADALRSTTRWIGVMGSPRHTAPHINALQDLGFDDAQIARVHRPIGLNIGSHSPGEIAIATVAGLLADRNGRTGGQYELTGSSGERAEP
ncbi:MAG TPA: XdhC family protein [Actinomycetes bacterium]|nr:XdhC family protein [Actinomycetes bacterium]